MWTKRNLVSGILAVAILLLAVMPARAATEEEIEQAIVDGLAWLAAQQNPNGSWSAGWEPVAITAFAVVKMEEQAFELGYDSPFDPEYEYSQNVIDGLDYLFTQAGAGAPGGICFAPGFHETYTTGVAMMAIAAGRNLNRVVTTGPYAGSTYGQILQANVNFFALSQNADGGWRYQAVPQPSDQSNTGYVVLGLSYVERFGVGIPASIKMGLNNWINAIQDPVNGDPDDGGSWYVPVTWPWVNELKTGNLIYEMTFVGDDPSAGRFQDALAYIERHWQDQNVDPGWGYNVYPADYQAMYCLMKGLEYSRIDLIDTDGDTVADDDWFNQDPPASPAQDFASVLVAQQNADGSWPQTNWDYGPWYGEEPILSAVWALLTLEKVVPPIQVFMDIKPQSCPNPVNLKSKGVLPVAVLGTEDFDVTQIDPASVKLSREGVAGVSPLRWAYEDVATPFEGELCDCHTEGPDGYMDLTLKFSTPELVEVLELADVAGETIPLTLTGNLKEEFHGRAIIGQDCVWVLMEQGPQKP